MLYPDLPERALSIKQPWASAIIHLGKDVENRGWSTTYRGPVCIHASARLDRFELDAYHRHIDERSIDLSGKPFLYFPDEPLGGIVGVANIVDCVKRSASPWFVGDWGFVLAKAKPVPFIPVRGALGFFDWRKNVLPPKQPSRQGALL